MKRKFQRADLEALLNEHDRLPNDELTQAFINQLPFAIALFEGPQFIVKSCNRAYKTILGREDIEGKRFSDAFSEFENQHFQFILSSVFRTGKQFVAKEFKALVANTTTGISEERFWDFSYTRVCDSNGLPFGIYFFGTDVTERVAQTNQLRAAQLESERASAAKSNFLANMSHEIRTPLGIIIGYTDLLRDERIDRNERVQMLEVVNRNAKSLTRVIDDILDLSKVEAGRLTIELSPMNLYETIKDIALLFQERAATNGVDLSVQIQPEAPENIIFDAVRLRQILINVLGNAVKFTERGTVKVLVNAKNVETDRYAFEIEVIDTGRGLSKEQRDRLFQPFTQADNTTTREFGGSGLGLILSRKMAEALGGNVYIGRTALNEGTTFHIVFEARVSSPISNIDVQPSLIESNKTPLALAGLRILIVEDSSDNQFLINRLLSRNGATVVIAENGLIGSEIALKSAFDVVLMDIQMPVMDGYSAIAKLKAAGYKRPIIALTAHALAEEREKTSAAGFSSHVTKPVEIETLIKSIHLVLGSGIGDPMSRSR